MRGAATLYAMNRDNNRGILQTVSQKALERLRIWSRFCRSLMRDPGPCPSPAALGLILPQPYGGLFFPATTVSPIVTHTPERVEASTAGNRANNHYTTKEDRMETETYDLRLGLSHRRGQSAARGVHQQLHHEHFEVRADMNARKMGMSRRLERVMERTAALREQQRLKRELGRRMFFSDFGVLRVTARRRVAHV